MFAQYLSAILLAATCFSVVHLQSGDDDIETYASQLLINVTQNNSRNFPDIRPNFGKSPLNVSISLMINAIYSISQHSMSYKVDFDVQTYWVDHRLTFPVRHNISELIVGQRNLRYIWLPDTYAPSSVKTRVQKTFSSEKTAFLRLSSTGAVTHETAISLTAECTMNLANFPFDRQNCSLLLGSYGKPDREVDYQWQTVDHSKGSSVLFRTSIDLPDFRLAGYEQWRTSTQKSVTGRFTKLGVSFILDRYYDFYVVRLYIPACLGVIISFLPFWLGRKSHFSRLSLGLSTVFTTSSLIAQTSSRLPVVAYLTALDIYLYTCYTVVTASLIEYALACYCETKCSLAGGDGGGGEGSDGAGLTKRTSFSTGECTAKRIDLFAKVFFPLGFCLFNIVYIAVVVVIVHGYSNENLTLSS